NGTAATEFDPALLGPGTHTVEACFDAVDATPGPIQAFEGTDPSGSQGDFSGVMGIQFDVNAPIRITQLGVFDHEQDGILGSYTSSGSNDIRVAIFERNTQTIVAGLDE
ncbi:hypothetical protein RZS08_32880, partial [Arthrospira platensis SPKY1]|nr:hypothetical protein [Arthrospira platensis SPKY1]